MTDRLTRTTAVGIAVAVTLGLLWTVLAIVVVTRSGTPTGLDGTMLSFMVGHRVPAVTAVMVAATTVGGTLGMAILAVVACGVLAWRRDWPHAAVVAAAGVGAAVLVPVFKNLVDRRRPPEVDQLVSAAHQAFPSGHALGSIAVVGALAVVARELAPTPAWRRAVVAVAVVFVAAVGISRVYLGVHWATDVLGGWLLGGAWLALCATLPRWLPQQQPSTD